ncbi:MAG TPA: DUF3352 domain-containing protein [Solirubrobacteraceae bacterium]
MLAALVIAVPLAGCGASSSPPLDPASVVPGTAPLYVSAAVQPSGSLKSNTTASTQKLTHSGEPFSSLLKLLSPSGRQLNYAHDVKPWLGARAGAFVTSLDAGKATEALTSSLSEAIASASIVGAAEGVLQQLLAGKVSQGAIVLDTTDTGKANAFLHARAQETGAHAASYRGVSYQVDTGGYAEGLVGKFAVLGSETALHSVIDTEQAGPASSILHAAPYAKLTLHAEPGALANLYLNTSGLPSLGGLLGNAAQTYLSLLPTPTSFALDIDTISSGGGSETGLLPGTAAAQFVGQLPGGSWLALGVGDVSATFGQGASTLRTFITPLRKLTIGTYSLEGVFAPLFTKSVDLNKDLLSWMGATGVFASGSGLLNLQAGVVIASKDPARSRAAVGKLAQAYRQAGDEVAPTTIPGAEEAVTVKIAGFPVIVAIGAGNGKFAIGLGPASVQEALNPTATLSSSANYQAAATTLGHGLKPSLLIEFPTLVSLIETLGLAQSEGISSALPYLQSLTTLSGGGGESLGNGVTRARVVLGLQ